MAAPAWSLCEFPGNKQFYFADFITDQSVHQEDSPLPAWTQLGGSGEFSAGEVETLVYQSFGQHAGLRFDEVVGQQIFPRIKRA